MVFSQTSHKTQSTLKVVDLNRLKAEKNQQPNGLTGEVTGVDPAPIPSTSAAAAVSSEEYLKSEPSQFVSTMYQNSDCEFFQDLGLWCSAPDKEEQVQTIDLNKQPEYTDTLYTQAPAADSSPLAGCLLGDSLRYPAAGGKEHHFQEQFLDIDSLPIVLEEDVAAAEPDDWMGLHNTAHTNTHTSQKYPFIDQEDSMDFKMTNTVVPRELAFNDVVISEFVINGKGVGASVPLTLDVGTEASWPAHDVSTPEVLSYVEQMEKETFQPIDSKLTNSWLPQEDSSFISMEESKSNSPSEIIYEPITHKAESHVESDEDPRKLRPQKRRHNSEESDETYTPYSEKSSPRKYTRRKSNIPIKDMIQALEESQPVTKARRGRPPKRRESTVSSVCSVDTTSSNHESKYREVRDKNNEASKRSRMNRKLKELQMEQLALDLEERNKKLKVKADILEDMTKRLKDALMSAILKQ